MIANLTKWSKWNSHTWGRELCTHFLSKAKLYKAKVCRVCGHAVWPNNSNARYLSQLKQKHESTNFISLDNKGEVWTQEGTKQPWHVYDPSVFLPDSTGRDPNRPVCQVPLWTQGAGCDSAPESTGCTLGTCPCAQSAGTKNLRTVGQRGLHLDSVDVKASVKAWEVTSLAAELLLGQWTAGPDE